MERTPNFEEMGRWQKLKFAAAAVGEVIKGDITDLFIKPSQEEISAQLSFRGEMTREPKAKKRR